MGFFTDGTVVSCLSNFYKTVILRVILRSFTTGNNIKIRSAIDIIA